MADNFDIIRASTVSLEELAQAFTSAFSGYFFPMSLNAEQLARRVRFEQLDLHRSLLMFAGGELAGIALLGLRDCRAWIGGFGITEIYRGRKLSHPLMRAMLAEAREVGARRLSLEVLRPNQAAFHLYERAGMKITRELIIFERDGLATSRPDDEGRRETPSLSEASASELLKHFHRLHRQPPAWQRDLPALVVMDGLRGLCLGERDWPKAYALLREGPGGVTSVVDLAAASAEAARALCAGLGQVAGPLRVTNEPEESIFNAPLKTYGFRELERQREMVITLEEEGRKSEEP
ncbi:MAG TPA: GNAT family N-acetyltransferase [Pyrinomonadaceae bacterium]|jgi:ribosomal protein S18 acetylase RimI-like enzyme